jgi:hypothetical protein
MCILPPLGISAPKASYLQGHVESDLSPGAQQDLVSSPRNYYPLVKRDDPEAVSRTVDIFVGVLLGVFLIGAAVIFMCLCRCTCTQQRDWVQIQSYRSHRQLTTLFSRADKASIQHEGGIGELGGRGRPGRAGQPGQSGGHIRGWPADKTEEIDDQGDFAFAGYNTLGGSDYPMGRPYMKGGAGIGGHAQGGDGGQGGLGGEGGTGGRGGDGGYASAHAEAYSSVHTFMMCCILVPPTHKARRPGSRSAPGPRLLRPTMDPEERGRDLGHPGLPDIASRIDSSHAASEFIPTEPRHSIQLQGGVGGGGEAGGGAGGEGGQGGYGGEAGGGGLGGQSTASASAFTPINPIFMCCIFGQPLSRGHGSSQSRRR